MQLNRLAFLKSLTAGALMALGAAHAADQGSPADAEAMVNKAVAYIKANGVEKALAEFNTGSSFKDRDLFVVAYDLNGVCLAYAPNPKLVGKNLIDLKDPNGVELIRMLTTLAKEKGKGWSGTYHGPHPITKQLQAKVMYVARVGELWVGTGVYK